MKYIALFSTGFHYIDEQEYTAIKDAWEKQQQRINELEQWIKAISDNAHVPDWIQQSARSLLAQEQK